VLQEPLDLIPGVVEVRGYPDVGGPEEDDEPCVCERPLELPRVVGPQAHHPGVELLVKRRDDLSSRLVVPERFPDRVSRPVIFLIMLLFPELDLPVKTRKRSSNSLYTGLSTLGIFSITFDAEKVELNRPNPF